MQRQGVKAPSYTTLSLSDEDGENTIVYRPKLKALYWVETAIVSMEEFNVYEHGGGTCIAPVTAATVTKTTKATRVFRCGEGGKRDLVASFVFCPHHNTPSGSGTITFASSETYRVGDFFRRKSCPSTSRLVSMPAGEFKWSNRSGIPKLYDSNRRLVARHFHRRGNQPLSFALSFSHDHNSKWRLPTLEVAHDAMRSLDLVILGWVVMMHDIAACIAVEEPSWRRWLRASHRDRRRNSGSHTVGIRDGNSNLLSRNTWAASHTFKASCHLFATRVEPEEPSVTRPMPRDCSFS